jgi:hypothetical protein
MQGKERSDSGREHCHFLAVFFVWTTVFCLVAEPVFDLRRKSVLAEG